MLNQFKHSGVRPLAAAILAVGALAGASQAWANTAADTTIRNTVTVNYSDAANTPQAALTAQVDVTVNLVRANPLLSAPIDQTTDSATNAVYSYTITNAANGIASYNLSTTLAQSASISASTANTNVALVTLGATTVASSVNITALGNTVITVPADNTNGDLSINGIAGGDTVVIGGQVYSVAGIGADVASPGTTTITLVGNGTAQVVASGTLIAERQGFTMTVDPGPVSGVGDQTITVDTTATDSVNNAFTGTDQTITTVRNTNLTVQKLVRNVTTGAAGLGPVVFGGNNYYASGVTGNPTDTLEYMIVVTNAVGAADATNVRISDPIPPFTLYTPTSMFIENGGVLSAALNDSGSDTDAAEFSGSAVYFYLGAGGTDGGSGAPLANGDGTGGTLNGTAPNNVSRAIFRVTIN